MISNVQRLAAFTTTPDGGNPAGVWVGDRLPDPKEMQATAAEIGYSETVFAAPATGAKRTVRYYSPMAEVPFCGHATIALGVALGTASDSGAESTYLFDTRVGIVPVTVRTVEGSPVAALTSVEPSQKPASTELIRQTLELLDWHNAELDPRIPTTVAYAGAHHLIIAVAQRETLHRLDYDFVELQGIMLDHDLTTLQLIWREDTLVFHARNPFPVGGVIEDPATGAAAAALGGYLRTLGLVDPPAKLTIHQGTDMGRPSRIQITIPEEGGIVVQGRAVTIPQPTPDLPRQS